MSAERGGVGACWGADGFLYATGGTNGSGVVLSSAGALLSSHATCSAHPCTGVEALTVARDRAVLTTVTCSRVAFFRKAFSKCPTAFAAQRTAGSVISTGCVHTERYDCETDLWEALPPMSTPRYTHTLLSSDDGR
jgi:hypothetical protein